MRKKVLVLIAGQLWRQAFRNKGIFLLTLIIGLLLAYAAISGWSNVTKQNSIRQQFQQAARHDWESNPDKHPHRMAHYGHFAFRPQSSLSFFDMGMESYMGSTVFLEAHKQNSVNFSEAGFSTGLLRFGEISIAMILQVLVPLLIIFLGFSSIAAERENGTLKILFSQGVTWQELIAGKSLGIISIVAVLYLPVIIVSILLWLALIRFDVSAGELLRLLCIAGAYLGYLVIYSLIAVLLSAGSKTARSALVKSIGVWLLFTIVLPRATQAVGAYLYPAPSAVVFHAAIEKDILKEGDSHNPDDTHYKTIKDSLLNTYRVDSVEKLPFNYSGFIMAEGEKISATIYDQHQAQLQQLYARQNSIARYAAFVNPFMAVKYFSMAITGTDYHSYVRFQDQAEQYRYELAQRMNELQMKYISNKKPGPDDKPYTISNHHWAALPEFKYQPPSLSTVIRQESISLAAFAAWFVLLLVVTRLLSKQLKVV
jgi:ABC-2 type transport system permease protein